MAPPARRARGRGDRRDARGERAAQGRRPSSPHTGAPAIADDTGLEVDALGGAPGVRLGPLRRRPDATYADNVASCSSGWRGVAARAPDRPLPHGRHRALARRPRGRGDRVGRGHDRRRAAGHGGFGYDPVFVPVEGDGRTFAEMTPDEKHAISHRGRAFRTLAEGLRPSRSELGG